MIVEAARRDSDGQRVAQDISGLALGYVKFATENEALFQLMFGREVGNLKDYPELRVASTRCYSLMADSVAAHLRESGSTDSPSVAATAAWSMVHGLSTLINDGRVGAHSCGLDSNEELVLQACQIFPFNRR